MANKTYDERLDDLKRKQEQLKEREKELKKKHAQDERKKSTRLKIELGGIVIAFLGREAEEGDKERLYRFLKRQEDNGKFFTKAMNIKPVEETGLHKKEAE